MNVNKNIKKTFLIILFFASFMFFYSSVKAGCSTCARTDLDSGDYIVQVGSKKDGHQYLYRQNAKSRVYCVKRGITSPAYGDNGYTKYTCSGSASFDSNNSFLKAAIGYVMANADGTDDNYIKSQKVIHKLLYKYNSGEDISSYDSELYNNAVSSATNYINGVGGTYYLAKVYSCGDGIQPIADGYETKVIKHYLTVNYYDGETKVGTEKYYYDNDYSTYGLTDYLTFKLTKTGHYHEGNWVTSDGKYTVKQDKGFATGQALAQALGADLTSADATVNVYTKWIPNKVSIAYNPNGGTTTLPKNQYGWVMKDNTVYFHTIEYGKNSDTYNISSLSITRPGYSFTGWKVHSTGTILDEVTEYSSTVYAQHNDKTQTTANTKDVYCYLYAQWSQHYLTVNYYDGNKFVKTETYYYDNDYSTYGLTNYSTFNLTKSGYTASGNWLTSDGKYAVNQDKGFATGQALAKALGKDLTSGNATVNVYTKWTENHLTVNYYDGDTKAGTETYYYDNDYSTYGLTDYLTFKLTKTGHHHEGNWVTSDGKYTVNQSTKFTTGQALAKALGKDLTSGNATVDVYTKWIPNKVSIAYHPNGGTTSLPKNQYGWVMQNDTVYFHTIKYNDTSDPRNINELGISRSGYVFEGWKVHSTGEILDQDTEYLSTVYAQHDNKNKTTANTSQVYSYLYAEWTPEFKIRKVTTKGILITSSEAKFGVYSDSSCTTLIEEITTSSGVATAKLKRGTYYIKETQKPNSPAVDNPYFLDDTCREITVAKTVEENKINVINKTQCEVDFENDSTITNRLKLYKKYGYRNLLNFDGVKIASDACSVYTPEYKSEETCLETKQVSNSTRSKFNKGNLSDYNDTITSSSSPTVSYCLTNFEIVKRQEINNKVSAGQLVINTSQNSAIVTGKITKTCYIHKDDINNYGIYHVVGNNLPSKKVYEVVVQNNSSDIPKLELNPNKPLDNISATPLLLEVKDHPDGSEDSTNFITAPDSWEEENDYNKVIITSGGNYINYNDYIDSIEIDNIKYIANNKILDFKNLVATRNSNTDEFYKIEESIEVDYIAKPVYAYKISGKICDNAYENCSLVGYGVISDFKDGEIGKNSFNFKINNSIATKPTTIKFKFNSNNTCEYEVKPEIITYDDNTNGDLDIEFRSLDKKEPFNRKTKSNWCDAGGNCDKNNSTVKSVIEGRNDSYNSTGLGGLYTNENSTRIVLTPDLITKIKDYNKNNMYNNYTVTTDKNGNKTSDFFQYIGLEKVNK